MLKLYPVSYEYKNAGSIKESNVTLYQIKGIKGSVRHALSQILREYDHEICHTTDTTELKDGTNILPKGFHPLGSCDNKCLISQIFGFKNQESLLSFFSKPIGYTPQTTTISNGFQRVHIATENRLVKTHDGISIQDFRETYFSGYFSFEIDVTDLNEVQRGVLYQAVMEFERLGRGYTTGYGHVEVRSLEITKRSVKKIPKITGNQIMIEKEIIEENLNEEIFSCISTFEDYIKK